MTEDIITGPEGLKPGYWTKKWGITNAQLNDAILQTGSLRTRVIRHYLRQRCCLRNASGWISFLRLSL
jgi:hypothetical protein